MPSTFVASAHRLVPIPVPAAGHAVLVHPHVSLETRTARAALAGAWHLHEFVEQSANLAMLIAGLYRGDASLVRDGLSDVLIEPRRAHLIAGFHEVKRAALECGAMGASISGAGPSVFAWFEHRDEAAAAGPAMQAAFAAVGLASDVHLSPIGGPAAEILR